jgi:hypothetical protein
MKAPPDASQTYELKKLTFFKKKNREKRKNQNSNI